MLANNTPKSVFLNWFLGGLIRQADFFLYFGLYFFFLQHYKNGKAPGKAQAVLTREQERFDYNCNCTISIKQLSAAIVRFAVTHVCI